jgi:hypothetical protein
MPLTHNFASYKNASRRLSPRSIIEGTSPENLVQIPIKTKTKSNKQKSKQSKNTHKTRKSHQARARSLPTHLSKRGEYSKEELTMRLEQEVSTIAIGGLQSYWTMNCHYYENGATPEMVDETGMLAAAPNSDDHDTTTSGGAGSAYNAMIKNYDKYKYYEKIFSDSYTKHPVRKTVPERFQLIKEFSLFIHKLRTTHYHGKVVVKERKNMKDTQHGLEYINKVNFFIISNKHFSIGNYFVFDTSLLNRTHRTGVNRTKYSTFTKLQENEITKIMYVKLFKGAGSFKSEHLDGIYSDPMNAYGMNIVDNTRFAPLKEVDQTYKEDNYCLTLSIDDYKKDYEKYKHDLNTQRLTLGVILCCLIEYHVHASANITADEALMVRKLEREGVDLTSVVGDNILQMSPKYEKTEDVVVPLHVIFNSILPTKTQYNYLIFPVTEVETPKTMCMMVDDVTKSTKELVSEYYDLLTLGFLTREYTDTAKAIIKSNEQYKYINDNATRTNQTITFYKTPKSTLTTCGQSKCFNATYKSKSHDIRSTDISHTLNSNTEMKTMIRSALIDMPNAKYFKERYGNYITYAAIMAQLVYYPTNITSLYSFPSITQPTSRTRSNIEYFGAYDPDPDFPEFTTTTHAHAYNRPFHRIHVWIDKTLRHVFFVCRGTITLRDWLHPDVQISQGMGFESDRIDEIRNALREVHRDMKSANIGANPDAFTLFTIGHSLGGFLANAAAVITYQNKIYKYRDTFTHAIAIPFQPFYSNAPANNVNHWKILNWGFKENISFIMNVENDFAAINLVNTKKQRNQINRNICIFEIPRLRDQIPITDRISILQTLKTNSHSLYNFYGKETFQHILRSLTNTIIYINGVIEPNNNKLGVKEATVAYKNEPFIVPSMYGPKEHP